MTIGGPATGRALATRQTALLDLLQYFAYGPGVMTEAPEAMLRRHGMHVTAQRLAVLRAVSEPPHSTADDIHTVVLAEIGSVSRQTVYDVLAALTDRGLFRRIQPAGSSARYENRVGDNHHHLVCRLAARWSMSTARWATPRASRPPTTRATRSTKPRSSTGAAALRVQPPPNRPSNCNPMNQPATTEENQRRV